MKFAKVQSRVLDEALKNPREFSSLYMYFAGFGGYERTEDGCFLSKIVLDEGKPTLDMKLSLFDYSFNESEEFNKLAEFAKKLLGKSVIDFKVVKVVEL